MAAATASTANDWLGAMATYSSTANDGLLLSAQTNLLRISEHHLFMITAIDSVPEG